MSITYWFSHYSSKALLIFFISSSCFAQNLLDLSRCTTECDITDKVEFVYVDKKENFNPLQNQLPAYFTYFNQNEIKTGYTDQFLWGRLALTNSSSEELTKVIYFSGTLTGFVDFYFKGQKKSTGSSLSLERRDNKSIYTSTHLSLKPGESTFLYFSRIGHHALATKILLGDDSDFLSFKSDREDKFKVYIGAIIALVFYNFFFAMFFKNKKYYIYCLFSVTLMSAALNLQGYLDYIDIFSHLSISHYLIINSSLATVIALEFGFLFLDAKTYLRDFLLVKRGLSILIGLPILIAILPIYDFFIHYLGYYIDFLIISTLIFLIVSSFVAKKRESPLAKVYIISWTFLFIGAFLYFGHLHGAFPKSFITENGILLGNVFEMIILSLGLAYQLVILDQQNEKAVILAAEKGKYQQLLRTLSHDISNSLHVVLAGSKRLLRLMDDQRHLMIAQKINSSANNMVEILEQVRAQEKLESDKGNIRLSRVNLVELLNENFGIFEDRLTSKNIIINTQLDNNAQYVLAERVSLKNNVMGNILSNAIKFSPKNSEISIKSKIINKEVILEIRDQGDGLSSEALDFFKHDDRMTVSTSGTSGEQGTGFGLKIIMSYLHLYGATLEVLNDNGAVFILKFKKP